MTPFHKGYDAFLRQQEKKTLSAEAHKITKAIGRPVTAPSSRGNSPTDTPSSKPIVPTAKKGVCWVIKPRRRRMDLAEWLRSGKAAFVDEKKTVALFVLVWMTDSVVVDS
jgi:hypothetical protein